MNWEDNPNHGKPPIRIQDYRDLGWQLHKGNSEEILNCHVDHHPTTEFDDSVYKFRGTNIIHICDICKHFWHIDMSD